MTRPEHAFAVLAYGESPFLAECVDSLLGQTRRSHVFISTSTPNCHIEAVARSHDLPLLVNPERSGMAADWSFAYAQSPAPLVTLAHQDDLYGSGYAEAVVGAMAARPEAVLAFTDYAELTLQGLRTSSLNLLVKKALLWQSFLHRTSIRTSRAKWRLLAFGSPIPAPSVTLNKQRVGAFRFTEAYKVNMDWDAWARLAELKAEFLYVRSRLMIHRIHAASATSVNLANQARQAEDERMFRRFWPGRAATVIAHVYRLSYLSNAT